MSFQPRTFETILTDMINYVRAYTDLTDFEVGSVGRTMLEASALEDDEQYFQMVQLMDAFSIRTATGTLLAGRLQDYNITKLGPKSSAGQLVIVDNTLVNDALSFDAIAGGSSVQLTDSTAFPGAGAYVVRLGEGTVSVEDVTVSSNNTSTGVLTLSSPTVNNHSAGDRAALVTGSADRVVAASVQAQVPAVGDSAPIKFVSIASCVIVNGNLESTPVDAQATLPGALGNVGANEITQFTGSPPFAGAGVRNPKKFAGGRATETDPQVKDRAAGQIQSLSRGTGLALKQAALGVVDPVTGQSVVSANLLENFILGEVVVYIDDGTGFTPDTTPAPTSALSANPSPGASSLTVVSAATFPNTGFFVVSPEDGAQIELVTVTGVNYSTNVLSISPATARIHNSGDQVVQADVLMAAAQAGTTILQTQNFPIVRNSMRLWVDSGAGLVLQPSYAYFLDRATGEIQLTAALVTGAKAVAAYTAYAGLVKTVQKVINGDDNDPVNFPGVASEGEIVVVETPVIRRVTVRVAITAQDGFTESDLTSAVQEAIQTYISSLRIGDDVIRSEIINVTMLVNGVYDVTVATPTGNVTVLPSELPVPYDSLGNSLVTVT